MTNNNRFSDLEIVAAGDDNHWAALSAFIAALPEEERADFGPSWVALSKDLVAQGTIGIDLVFDPDLVAITIVARANNADGCSSPMIIVSPEARRTGLATHL
ncbi:MAG: hypothetical protein AAF213_08280, partial [Pseudomonadota bacterium]